MPEELNIGDPLSQSSSRFSSRAAASSAGQQGQRQQQPPYRLQQSRAGGESPNTKTTTTTRTADTVGGAVVGGEAALAAMGLVVEDASGAKDNDNALPPPMALGARNDTDQEHEHDHNDDLEDTSQNNMPRSRRDRLVRRLLLAYPSKRNLALVRRLNGRQLDYRVFYPRREPDDRDKRDAAGGGESFAVSTRRQQQQQQQQQEQQANGQQQRPTAKANQVLGHYNRTNVVIKAFNYKFRLDLELNNNLFGPSLIQKHFLPKGAQQISTQKIEHCYYHARSQPEARPSAIGAFRTCNGLSGIIHVDNESFVIHPFYANDLNKKHPHIIYRYQASAIQDFVPNQQQSAAAAPATDNQLAAGGNGGDGGQAAGGEGGGGGGASTSPAQTHRQCGNSRLHEWALRQHSRRAYLSSETASSTGGAHPPPTTSDGTACSQDDAGSHCDTPVAIVPPASATAPNQLPRASRQETVAAAAATTTPTTTRFSKRDVGLTEKYIELALILSQDMFDKRNSSTRLEVLHDAIQIVNCLDLYFRSANTRVALIYIETWAHGDQIELSADTKQTLSNFLEYSARKLYKVSMDAVHLLTGGHARQFESNEVGMSIPGSICTPRAVSVSQEASVFEPFIAASTMAHMLGHNLGMEHDAPAAPPASAAAAFSRPVLASTLDSGGISTAVAQATTAGGDNNSPEQAGVQPNAWTSLVPTPPRRPLKSSSSNASDSQLDTEEHDDEIKSRSLVVSESERGRPRTRSAVDQLAAASTSMSGSDASATGGFCQANCLMSEGFVYFQPPVSFGTMIQQQVNSSGGSSPANSGQQSAFSVASGGVTTFSVTPIEQQQQQQQRQLRLQQLQQLQRLNGPIMNQIDGELQNEPLMSATNALPFKFSRQSIDAYHRNLRQGHGICLFNKPNQLEDFKTCGNGIVDRGEDCDCGTFQECLENDSCCDPITCRFKADAECINGACCDRCKLRPKGFVCRRSRGECDLAEMCDGKSGQCSPDVHKQNGHPCSFGAGYCYLGQCPQHDLQCAELWGMNASRADRLCYASFNVNGTIRGNCGYEPALRKYKRCDPEHMMCGTLQCQEGDMKPVTASVDSAAAPANAGSPPAPATTAQQHGSPEFSKKTLHGLDGSRHECKAITGSLSGGGGPQQFSTISYVRDGSKCAPNKVCFNQTCQPLEQVYRDAYELCPRDEKGRHCSANGICSTANRCHCEPGWTGHDCSQRWSGHLSVPSVSVGDPRLPTVDNTIDPRPSGSSATFNLNEPTHQAAGVGAATASGPTGSADAANSTPVFIRLPVNTGAGGLMGGIGGGEQPAGRSTLVLPGQLVATNAISGGGGGSGGIASQPALKSGLPQQSPLEQQEPVPSVVVVGGGGAATPVLEPAVAATTTADDAATTTTTTAAPSANSSNVVLDKKKHDALGAPTLVFILVSIVAAVYVGFALMANCYRRKGFIKPDKVLRHHQMNCKLDAIRSSFIAKRLADAAVAGSILENGPGSNLSFGTQRVAGGGGGEDLSMNPFSVSSMSAAANQMTCQHMGPMCNPGGGATAADLQRQLPQLGFDGGEAGIMKGFQVGQPQSSLARQQQIPATVHYFDEHQQHHQRRDCIHHQHKQRAAAMEAASSFGYEPDGGGDHIPLLMTAAAAATSSSASHTGTAAARNRQVMMRSFANNRPPPLSSLPQKGNHSSALYQADNWPVNSTSLGRSAQQAATVQRLASSSSGQRGASSIAASRQQQGSQINRATSLGNVNHQRQQQQQQRQQQLLEPADLDFDVDDDDETTASRTHRALATPLRSGPRGHPIGPLGSASGSYYRRAITLEDNFSAPSSPDHRDPCWSDAERQAQRQALHTTGRCPFSRQPSTVSDRRQALGAGVAGYHEDAILGALTSAQKIHRRGLLNSQQQQQQQAIDSRQHSIEQTGDDDDDDDDEEEAGTHLPPLPPPPLPPAHLAALDGGNEAESEDSEPAGVGNSQSRQMGRQLEFPSAKSPVAHHHGWSTKTVRRIPLNSGEPGLEQLSLISQLQQLERVQSLHQKQISNDKKMVNTTTSDGLHEFFSLPLSVQLSALLARSLRESRESPATPIEDILNTLNNSNVAASSRRSFKGASGQQQQQQVVMSKEQQQQGGSWGGTMKRQQMKLHNLQGLINRLQKLHSQTVLQQQLEELNGELDDDLTTQGSRQSTLGRPSRSRSVSRANQTADDLFAVAGQDAPGAIDGWAKKRRSVRPRDNGGGSKNESVYSMSDSEDGAFVSRILISNYQQQRQQQEQEHSQLQQRQPHQQQESPKNELNDDAQEEPEPDTEVEQQRPPPPPETNVLVENKSGATDEQPTTPNSSANSPSSIDTIQ